MGTKLVSYTEGEKHRLSDLLTVTMLCYDKLNVGLNRKL
jgi:hypothetical protein